MKFDPILASCTKINSQWIKNLNLRPENVKLRRKHIEILLNISLRNDFLDITPEEQATSKNRQINYTKVALFCTAKETIEYKSNLWNRRKYL